MSDETNLANGGVVRWAPIGSSPGEIGAWTPIGHAVNGFTLSGFQKDWIRAAGDEEMRLLRTFPTGHTITLDFKVRRRDITRLLRLLKQRPRGDVRLSAMHSAYHRRQKRRSR